MVYICIFYKYSTISPLPLFNPCSLVAYLYRIEAVKFIENLKHSKIMEAGQVTGRWEVMGDIWTPCILKVGGLLVWKETQMFWKGDFNIYLPDADAETKVGQSFLICHCWRWCHNTNVVSLSISNTCAAYATIKNWRGRSITVSCCVCGRSSCLWGMFINGTNKD